LTPSAAGRPSYAEAAIVVAISFGWFILQSVLAVANGFPTSATFSDASLGSLAAVELLFGAFALWFLRARGYSLAALLPSPDWRGVLEGAVLCALAILACNLALALFPSQTDAVQPIAQIVANARASAAVVLAVSMLNGVYEETFLLGYLMRGFAEAGASFALGLSVLVRLLYHLYQGPLGAVSVVVCGLVLGAAYWRTRRLWPVALAHALIDMIALS
jgi:membrane protease YdiL (CAAX protease family)